MYEQPLEFMDNTLGKTMEAVVVGTSGVLVRVPEPARFAIHKPRVAGNRDPRSAIKVQRDPQHAGDQDNGEQDGGSWFRLCGLNTTLLY